MRAHARDAIAIFGKPLNNISSLNLSFAECPICRVFSKSNPSFKVNVENGKTYCFRCRRGGHISFYIKTGANK